MKDLFTTLIDRLKAEVPQARTVARWNNQLANEAQERPANVAMPAIYLEVTTVKYTTISTGIQHGQGMLRVRHCTKSLKDADFGVYDLEAAAYLALQNFSEDPLLTGLDRSGGYPDANHAAVEMLITEYTFKYVDKSGFDQRFGRTSGTLKPEVRYV